MLATLLALLLAAPVQLALEPGSRLWIEGDSNLRTWSCEAQHLDTTAQARTGELGAKSVIETLRVAVPVKDLRCGDDHMDEKLRDALKAGQHPRIEYVMTAVQALPGAAPGEYRLKTTGTLTVAGVTKTETMLVLAGAGPGGTLFARGSLALQMSSFGVDPPSAFLGLLQSKDRIVIRFALKARAVRTVAAFTSQLP